MKQKIIYNTEFDHKIDLLLEILICPKTGGKLKYSKKTKELISDEAKLAYPILDNIPILLEEKARKL